MRSPGVDDARGVVEVALTQCVIRMPKGVKSPTLEREEVVKTPHTVTVQTPGRTLTETVEMKGTREITMR